jgi:hypothetical protein
VPRLFEVNGWKLDELPKFEPTNIDPPDLDQLAQFISSYRWCGYAVVPGPGAGEVHPRHRSPAGDDRRDRRVQAPAVCCMQQQAMEYADSQMEMLGMQQKAEHDC